MAESLGFGPFSLTMCADLRKLFPAPDFSLRQDALYSFNHHTFFFAPILRRLVLAFGAGVGVVLASIADESLPPTYDQSNNPTVLHSLSLHD